MEGSRWAGLPQEASSAARVCGGLMLPTRGRGLERHPEGEQRGIFVNAGLQARLLRSPVHSVVCDDVLGGRVCAGWVFGGGGLLPDEAALGLHSLPGMWVPRAVSHEWLSTCSCPRDRPCW